MRYLILNNGLRLSIQKNPENVVREASMGLYE